MRWLAVSFVCVFSGVSLFAEIAPGVTAESVRKELGPPNGSVEIGQTVIFFYDRGEVVLRNNLVTDTNLLSESELTARQASDDERRALLARIAEERRSAVEAEGLALKQSKVDSPGFQSLPASERVAFWRQFQVRYPMVSVELELNAAQTQAAIEENEKNRLSPEEAALVLARGRQDSTYYSPYPYRSYGWSYGIGVTVGDACPPYKPGYRPGHKPGHRPSHPIHPGKPHRPKTDTNPRSESVKGAIMATPDRERGRIDAGYSASRGAIYRAVTP